MSEEAKDVVGVIVLIVFVSLFVAAITHSVTDWSWRRQIAGHHAAEFYLDGGSYRQWRWIDCNSRKSSPVSVPNDSNMVSP